MIYGQRGHRTEAGSAGEGGGSEVEATGWYAAGWEVWADIGEGAGWIAGRLAQHKIHYQPDVSMESASHSAIS